MTSLPRLTDRCSEDLGKMERTERGVFCTKCRIDVVDLRRTPKKKALAVLNDLRRASPDGRVCAWLPVRPDGTPAFAADPPSRLARLAAPALVATSLVACAPREGVAVERPIAAVTETSGNANAPPSSQVHPVVHPVVTGQAQPPSGVIAPVDVEMAAGGLAWSGP